MGCPPPGRSVFRRPQLGRLEGRRSGGSSFEARGARHRAALGAAPLAHACSDSGEVVAQGRRLKPHEHVTRPGCGPSNAGPWRTEDDRELAPGREARGSMGSYLMLNLVLALLAGVVTVAAPCTLPMLPILLGASVGHTGKARPALIALGFVLSFSAAALLLSAITRIFDFDPNMLRTGAAILLLGFGVLMVWPAPFEWLSIWISGPINGSSA